MIRLMIADDHDLVRKSIRYLIETQSDLILISEASSGIELINKLRDDEHPDLLVSDLNMPGNDGMVLIREIRDQYPDLPILVFSSDNSLSTIQEALQAGASGFVSKNCRAPTLLQSIREVLAVGRFLEPEIASNLR